MLQGGWRTLLLLLLCAAGVVVSSSKISPRVAQVISQRERNVDDVHLWVYFTDKDQRPRSEEIKQHINPHALKRRGKVMNEDELVTVHDFPVNLAYISQVEAAGIRVRRVSKWLNAVSTTVPSSTPLSEVTQILSELSFVSKIDIMASYTRNDASTSVTSVKDVNQRATTTLQYGNSYAQLQMINVPNAHARGYNGSGVIVLILDSGYDKTHPAIAPLRIVAEYDFLDNDNETQSIPPDDQNNHGTATLSALGGWAPRHLIGSAFGASFLLAKTENAHEEFRTEEDNFIAAIEWGESLGADVATASLGYTEWYSFYEIDGTVSPVTRVCDMASKRGLTIVASAGNLDSQGIATPADAFEVISVGAVQPDGTLAAFSSLGPAADGRIKPDVTARGQSVWAAYAFDGTYAQGMGTSFSGPLVAGVVAIMLQVHPDWTPRMIKEALQMTASRSRSPDISLGWGIVNAIDALNYTPRSGSCEVNGCSNRGCCVNGECQCNHPFFGTFCSFLKVSCYSFCGVRTGGKGECLKLASGRSYRCAAPGGNVNDTTPTPRCAGCPLNDCSEPTLEPLDPTIEPPEPEPTTPPPSSTTLANDAQQSASPSLFVFLVSLVLVFQVLLPL